MKNIDHSSSSSSSLSSISSSHNELNEEMKEELVNEEFPKECIQCGRKRENTARSHWKKHLNTTHKYPCDDCKLSFAHKTKLKTHIREIHNSDEYIKEEENELNNNEDMYKTSNIIDGSDDDDENEPIISNHDDIEMKDVKQIKIKIDNDIKMEKNIMEQKKEKIIDANKKKRKFVEEDNNNNNNGGDDNNENCIVLEPQNKRRKLTHDHEHRSEIEIKKENAIKIQIVTTCNEQKDESEDLTTAAILPSPNAQNTPNIPNTASPNQQIEQTVHHEEEHTEEKEDPFIQKIYEERDKLLRLYSFKDFKIYDNMEQITKQIHESIHENIEIHNEVFKEQEKDNETIQNIESVFNTCIFPIFHREMPKITPTSIVQLPSMNPVVNVVNTINAMARPILLSQPLSLQPPIQPMQSIQSIQQIQPMQSIQQMQSIQPMQPMQTLLPNINPMTNNIVNSNIMTVATQKASIMNHKNNANTNMNISKNNIAMNQNNNKIIPKINTKYHGNHHHHIQQQNNSTHYCGYSPNKQHTKSHNSGSHSSHSTPTSYSTRSTPSSRSNSRSSSGNNRNYHDYHHKHNSRRHSSSNSTRYHSSSSSSSYSKHHSSSSSMYNKHIGDPSNTTLFIDNIPLTVSEDSLRNAFRKQGSIKSVNMRTKQTKSCQYALVICFQKHICDSIIRCGHTKIPLTLKNGQIVHTKLLISYHDEKKVQDAKKKRMEQREHH